MRAKSAKVVRIVLLSVLPVVVGFVLLILAIAWLAGAFHPKIGPGREQPAARHWAGESKEPTYEIHEVTKDYIEEAIGSLKAASRTAISAKVLATIVEVTITAGDQVEEGDVLVQLDAKELETRVRQAEQVLAAATAARKQAEQGVTAAVAARKESELDYNRTKSLRERQAVPQAALETATARLDVAKADELRAQQALNQGQAEELRAEQAVDEAKTLLSYATIKAPKAGRIVDRLAEEGDMARPGEPLLVLYDVASLRLEAPVQESLAVKLQVGQKLNVHIDALQRDIEATIDEIVPQADAPSRSFLVKAALPRSSDLYEGLFGRLLIPAGSRRHLCLATDAIQRVGQLQFVDVVVDEDIIEKRFIKTGREGMPGRVEVLSGLEAGEKVLLHGPSDSATTDEER
jgi:RND family efflux transporter MFP subunit